MSESLEHAATEQVLPPAAPESFGTAVDVDKAPIATDRVKRLVHAFEDFDSARKLGGHWLVRQ